MMKTIARRTVGVLLVGVVAVAVGVFLLVAVGPHTGQYRTLTVLSASMRPTFPAGSVVVVTPTAAADLAVGDVITYRIPVEDHRVVTHRIIEIVEAGAKPVVRTQGDANNAPDAWLARLEGDTVWTARAGVPYLGHGISILRDPLLSRLLVFVCPLLFAILCLIDLWRPNGEDPPAHAAAAGLPIAARSGTSRFPNVLTRGRRRRRQPAHA